MGFSGYDPALREFVIAAPEGIGVLAPRDGDQAMLPEVAEDDSREGTSRRTPER